MNAIIKLLLAITASFMMWQTKAQTPKGAYSGTLDVQGTRLELIFNFSDTDGSLRATLDVPTQGASGIAMDSTSLDGDQISIKSGKLKMSYLGTFENNSIK